MAKAWINFNYFGGCVDGCKIPQTNGDSTPHHDHTVQVDRTTRHIRQPARDGSVLLFEDAVDASFVSRKVIFPVARKVIFPRLRKTCVVSSWQGLSLGGW
jgi:hypothetical protein